MRYEEKDDSLIGFIKDPIKNISTALECCNKPNLFVKLLFKIPQFRKLLSASASKQILYQLVHKLHCIATEEIEKNTPIVSIPFDRHLPSVMQTINIFFGINISIETALPKEAAGLVRHFKEVNALAKFEYHCNRIMQLHSVQGRGAFPATQFQALWKLFFLSEMIFLIETKQMQVRATKTGIAIGRTEQMLRATPAYWVSETSESHSVNADRFVLSWLNEQEQIPKSISPQQLVGHVDSVMDKVFSIQTEYLPNNLRRTDGYKLFWDTVAFAILIETFCRNNLESIAMESIRNLCLIRYENLDFIDTTLSSLDRHGFADTVGFVSIDRARYIRGGLNFKYGIKRLLSAVMHAHKIASKENFFGLYGKIFENEFIFQKISELDNSNYKVFRGFKPTSSKSEVKDYDIDIILHHTLKNKFYFIQVKYFSTFIPTYLSEQCEFLKYPKFVHGMNQLLNLKGKLNFQSIRQILEKNGLANATNENSHFLLVHNLPFLNFYEHQGVTLYEWNLLRNILKGGHGKKFSKEFMEDVHMNEDFDLERPDDIAHKYIENTVMESTDEGIFTLFLNSTVVLKLDGIEVACDML